jgi:hypothetical protein
VKVFGLTIGRNGHAEYGVVEPGRQYAAMTGVKGAESSEYWMPPGGIDTNPDLSGPRKWEVYQEMRLSDPTVRSCLYMYRLPIRSAHWTIEPADDGKDPVDRLVADACAMQLGLEDCEGWLDQSWKESVSQALLVLDWGVMFEEIVWGDPVSWAPYEEDVPAEPRLIRPIVRLAPRPPSSIQEVEFDQAGRVIRLTQNIPDTQPIPGEKLVYLVLEKEGGNWWGTSLLRPMYGPWRLKKSLMVAAAIGWDRFSAGTPKVRHPDNEQARQKARQIGENLRLHEKAYVTLPGPPPEQGGEWDVEILSGSTSLADPSALIHLYDEQIVTAALQMFTRLGTTETGSRAVGEVLADPYYLAVQNFADYVAVERKRQVLRPFVNENFGAEIDLPTITASKITARSIVTLAQAIGTLADAGFSFTDRETQNDIRDTLELRPLPEVEEVVRQLPEEVGVEVTPSPVGTPPPTYPREGDDLGI